MQPWELEEKVYGTASPFNWWYRRLSGAWQVEAECQGERAEEARQKSKGRSEDAGWMNSS